MEIERRQILMRGGGEEDQLASNQVTVAGARNLSEWNLSEWNLSEGIFPKESFLMEFSE
jgi:hypothetical protein